MLFPGFVELMEVEVSLQQILRKMSVVISEGNGRIIYNLYGI